MHLIVKRNHHSTGDVSQQVVKQFEKAIRSDKTQEINLLNSKGKLLSLIYKWLFTKFNLKFGGGLLRNKYNQTLAIHMGQEFGKSIPYFLTSNIKIAYFFDVWPYTYGSMLKFLKNLNIDILFISSKQTTNYFLSLGLKNVYWIPEAVEMEAYRFNDYLAKDIDVLELGRRYSMFHEKIKLILENNNKVHYFENPPGKIIFPTNQAFVNGLARTKICICFPRSTTHNEVAGDVNTVTNRYFQSMASKCLIVGECPPELKVLFGYDPVITLNSSNLENEILEILENYSKYYLLIEKNFETVRKLHSWNNRWEQMKAIINQYQHLPII
tara:strand:- start:111 stop:1088 length:978 start_codon:yes stop_codon:yes gene_type:complete